MQTQILNFNHSKLTDIVNMALKVAKSNGATSAEVDISVATGKNVSVRLGNLETIELNNDKSLTYFLNNNQSNVTNETLHYCGLQSENEFNIEGHIKKSLRQHYQDR